jgi:phosphoribosyl 1,2-cyclic phosphodiesterase
MQHFLFSLLLALPMSDEAESMFPLHYERLEHIEKISCGIKIHEWRGSKLNSGIVNRFCSLAKSNFVGFISKLKKDYVVKRLSEKFEYDASFIPDNKQKRNLNDTTFRFKGRDQPDVFGYTNILHHWMFVTSDYNDSEFGVTLAHEVFHAMSDFHMIVDQHSALEEEILARDFTEYLGLGR